MYLTSKNFQRYKTNTLFLAFNYAKNNIFFNNLVWLLNKTANEKVKQEFSEK